MSVLDELNRIMQVRRGGISAGFFYCPYVPLTYTSPSTSRPYRAALERREKQGGRFDAVGVIVHESSFTREDEDALLQHVQTLAVERWGEPGDAPALWKIDGNIIFTRDRHMLRIVAHDIEDLNLQCERDRACHSTSPLVGQGASTASSLAGRTHIRVHP